MKVNKNNSVSYSDDEKKKASQISTVAYLERNYGFHFNFKNNYYKCTEHDSLVIYPDQKGWVWNSQGLKGGDVISFIMNYEKLTFVEALDKLVGSDIQYNSTTHIPKNFISSKTIERELLLPKKESGKFSRVYAYLCYTRRIDKNIINYCFKNNSLYQDERGNCVFVGFDNNNEPAYGAIRGTLTEKKYRGDCAGSNKKFGFKMIFDKTNPVIYVFESPIDAMSHATISNLVYKSNFAYQSQNRLALGGLNTVHLDKFLEDNPQITTIKFCLDNDNIVKRDGIKEENHGQIFANKCCEKYSKLGYKVHNICPKKKDFNDDLIMIYCGQNDKQKNIMNNGVTRK